MSIARSRVAILALCLPLALTTPTKAADRVAAPPELVTRISHSSNITAMAFSSDGSTLASVSSDGRLILWNTSSGDQLRTLRVTGGLPSQVAVSRSGRYVFVLSQIGITKYSVESRRSEVVLRGPDYGAFEVSGDGQWLAVERASGVTLRQLTSPHAQRVLLPERTALHQTQPVFAFRGDSRQLAIGLADGSVTTYVLGPRIFRTIQRIKGFDVHDIAFSKTNGVVVAGCFWATPDATHCGLQVRPVRGRQSLIDIAEFRPSDMKLSRDGSSLLTFGSHNSRNVLEFFALSQRASAISVDSRPADTSLGSGLLGLGTQRRFSYPVAISSDGRWLAAARDPSWDRIVVRQIENRQELLLKAGSIHEIEQLAFVNKGASLAVSHGNETELWDLVRGGLVASWPSLGSFAVSPDSFSLAFFDKANELQVVDTRTLRAQSLRPSSSGIFDVIGISDGATSVIWSKREFVTEYLAWTDGLNPQPVELCHFSLKPVHSFEPRSGLVAFLCDSESDAPKIVLWNLGNHTKTELAGSIDIVALAMSSNGQRIAAVWRDGSVTITNTRNSRTLRLSARAGLYFSSVSFAQDGESIVAGRSDGAVVYWDSSTGQVKVAAIHGSEVDAVSTSSRMTASGGYDGAITLFDARQRSALGTLVSVENQGWFATTAAGLFDGTPDALQWAGWRQSWKEPIIPLDTFFEDFYTPGVLTSVWQGDHPMPPAGAALSERLRIPGLHSLVGQGLVRLDERNGSLRLCMRDKPTSDLLENLGLTFQGEPQVLTPDRFGNLAQIDCHYAVTLNGHLKDYELVSQYLAAAEKPLTSKWDDSIIELQGATVHVQTVALKDYPKVPTLALHYAIADAEAFESYFATEQSLARENGPQIKIWDGLRDNQATIAEVRRRLEEIGKTAKEEDVVVLFFTGHGAVPPGEEMFYFLTADVGGLTSSEIRSGGLSALMLADAVRGLRARRVVVILDACLSGGSLDSLGKVALAKIRTEEQRDLMDDRPSVPAAVYVFAAATPFQNAIELSKIGHGVFTKALLDSLNNDQVMLRSLLPRLRSRVDELSVSLPKKQTPVGLAVGADFSLKPSRKSE
jgi:WD40 repeat protein